MKTNLFLIQFLTTILILSTNSLFAQNAMQEIEVDSKSSFPTLLLTETQNNDFARLFFTNSNTSDRWALSGNLGSTAEQEFGFYYNGAHRVVYNETLGGLGVGTDSPEDLLHVSGGDAQISDTSPRLDIISDGTNASTLGFGDNGGSADASISYNPSSGILSLTTVSASGNISMPRKVGFNETNDLTAQVTIKANSGTTSTPVQLELRENNNSDYARMRFSQFSSTSTLGYWDIAAKGEPLNSSVGDPKINFYYHTGSTGSNIMTIDGDDQRVGVRESNPEYDLHIEQSSTTTTGHGGLALNSSSSSNMWKIYHSGSFCSFANGDPDNGTALERKAYITDSGSFVDAIPFTGDTEDSFNGNSSKQYNQAITKVAQLHAYQTKSIKDKKDINFLLSDIETVFPEAVFEDEYGNKGIIPSKFAYLAIAAINEQQSMIKAIEQQNQLLQQQITLLQQNINE